MLKHRDVATSYDFDSPSRDLEIHEAPWDAKRSTHTEYQIRWAPLTVEEHSKRQSGRYYTAGNPFSHPAFLAWAELAKLRYGTILEPFAGANSLISHLQSMGLCSAFSSFDIAPASPDVRYRDTLTDFPNGYEVCVTNPPWLAKNSAAVRGLAFPDSRYDDLYKVALGQCLENCRFVAALVPESFIRANLFQERLLFFISLRASMFEDTGHPVGLALFDDTLGHPDSVQVWSGDRHLGNLAELEQTRPRPLPDGPEVIFNEPRGNVGLIALDNTVKASVRFCDVAELADYAVKPTGRHITKLAVDGPVRITEWNDALTEFRNETHDVLMTCYKGIRRDGMYRRRCDWALARGIIHDVG